MKLFFRNILLIASTLSLSCSGNYLKEMADKKDEKALLQDVKIFVNEKDYASAIVRCQQMDADYLASRIPAYWCASALAGRCGLDMLDFVTYFDSYAGSALEYLMDEWPATTYTQVELLERADDCESAEDLLSGIGSASARTTDENALMVLIALKKLGVVSKSYADFDSLAALDDNDGAIDGGYDGCTADLPDSAVQQLGSAIVHLSESGALSGIPGADTLATTITAACGVLDLMPNPEAVNFCNAADVTNFTPDELLTIRTIVRSENPTFGLECAGNFAACECFP